MKINLAGQWPVDLQEMVEKVAEALIENPPHVLPTGVVSLKLVDDAEIARLNKEYSGNAYATDVLSFRYNDPAELGDVVISLETAKKQAVESGSVLESEVALLALHGILHVIGYDHASEKERIRMNKIQSQLLRRSGISAREFKWSHK